MMATAVFYKDGKRQEAKGFRVSKDETLYYRTIVAARDYGEAHGYDKFRLDGETYKV